MENINAPHYWPFCERNPQVTGQFPSKRTSNSAFESVSMLWHHHENIYSIFASNIINSGCSVSILPFHSEAILPFPSHLTHNQTHNGAGHTENVSIWTCAIGWPSRRQQILQVPKKNCPCNYCLCHAQTFSEYREGNRLTKGFKR